MKTKTQQGAAPKPIEELFDLNETDLYELHDRLWYEYFNPKEPHTKEAKDFIRLQLNHVAGQIKLDAEEAGNPAGAVKLVEPSDKVEWDEIGPNSRKVIYCEVVENPKGHFETRAAKTGKGKDKKKAEAVEDLLGEDEEDLLGESPKKDKKKGAAGGAKLSVQSGKSNYDIVAELAAKGKDKDQIQAATGLARKVVTDNLWRYNKNKGKK